jgi:hypothetical protein
LRLLELADVHTAIFLQAFEGGWALDSFFKEIGQINGSILATEETVLDTTALDIGTLVEGAVLVGGELGTRLAILQMAIERLDLVDPD